MDKFTGNTLKDYESWHQKTFGEAAYMSHINQHILDKLVRRDVKHNLCQTYQAAAALVSCGSSDLIDENEFYNLDSRYVYSLPDNVWMLKRIDSYSDSHVLTVSRVLADDKTGDEIEVVVSSDFSDFYDLDDLDALAEYMSTKGLLGVEQLVDDFDSIDMCEEYVEVYEHWAVDEGFMRALDDKGEITGELFDFNVWGRTCTGQMISMDRVVMEIAFDMGILHGMSGDWSKKL